MAITANLKRGERKLKCIYIAGGPAEVTATPAVPVKERPEFEKTLKKILAVSRVDWKDATRPEARPT